MNFCKIKLNLLLFCLISFVSPICFGKIKKIEEGHPPFWRGNAKVFKRIVDQRDIVVSVQSHEPKRKELPKTLKMQGIGIVNVNASKAFELTKDFEKLKGISDHITELKFNSSEKKLFMHSQAFKYHARMWMEVEFDEKGGQHVIRFKVVKGVFAGMVGAIRFRDRPNLKSEITLLAEYSYNELPVPHFFIEFGLEVVLQKIAAKVRTYVEARKKQREVSGGWFGF